MPTGKVRASLPEPFAADFVDDEEQDASSPANSPAKHNATIGIALVLRTVELYCSLADNNGVVTSAGIGYLAALFLAATFIVAAVAKLRHVGQTADEFDLLGVPGPDAMARIIPVVELAIAVALVWSPSVGGLAALVTLAFFTTFLVGRLRSGVRVPCACFGAAGTAPLSGIEIIRNLGLVVLAATAMLAQDPTVPSALDIAVMAVAIGAGALSLRAARSR